MIKTILRALFCVSFLSSTAMGCPADSLGQPGFQPRKEKRDLRNAPILGQMSEELFDQAMDIVEEIYQDYLGPAGIQFSVVRDYASNYENAHPGRNGSHWFIEMYGGLFRNRNYETYENLVQVACHEVGHHLGETAYYSGTWSWASAEGQSDYFATLKCLRLVFADEDNKAWVENYPIEIPQTVTQSCHKAWKDEKDANICIRSAMAGFHVEFSSSGTVSFDTPDQYEVHSTLIRHPDSQCRLDTNFQGALCVVDHNTPTVAGDVWAGNCNPQDHEVGLRPACWFKSPE